MAINLQQKLRLLNEHQAVRLSPARRSERWRAEETETERRQKETRGEGEKGIKRNGRAGGGSEQGRKM